MVYRPPNCTRSRYKFHVFKHNVRFLFLFFHPLSHCLSRLLDLSIYFMSPSIFFSFFLAFGRRRHHHYHHHEQQSLQQRPIFCHLVCTLHFHLSLNSHQFSFRSCWCECCVHLKWIYHVWFECDCSSFYSYSFASRSCSVGIFIVLKAMHCSNSYGEFLQCLRFTTMAKLKQYQFKRRGQFFVAYHPLYLSKSLHTFGLFSSFFGILANSFQPFYFLFFH